MCVGTLVYVYSIIFISKFPYFYLSSWEKKSSVFLVQFSDPSS